MPAQNPLTRIAEVATGLRMLADDLQAADIDPINLRHWATELDVVRAELEASGEAPRSEGGEAPPG